MLDNKKLERTDEEQRKIYLGDAQDQFNLANLWRENGDERALKQLMNSHYRLSVSMAMKVHKKYGQLNGSDLIQEANVGLALAANKYDPDKGVLFSTYAQWWIKASLQDHVMRESKMVRIGTTAKQKKLFFNMRRVENDIQIKYPNLNSDDINLAIADKLNVPVSTVSEMQIRMRPDISLNAPLNLNGEGAGEIIDTLADGAANTETQYATKDEFNFRSRKLKEAISELKPREALIIKRRKLKDTPDTLEVISNDLNLSRERVRQIEVIALQKLTKKMSNICQ